MINIKKYIFIIGTEHQLIQVDEAIKFFNLPAEDIILFLFKVKINDTWVDNIVLSKTISNIKIFENWVAKDLLLNRQKIKNYIDELLILSNGKFNFTVFISNYYNDASNLAYSILKPQKYYLMDEGTASFEVVFRRNKSHPLLFKQLLNSLFYGHNIQFPENLIFFTQYPLNIKSSDSIETYSFNSDDKTERKYIKDEVIFLGSSLVENEVMDEEVYLSIMKKIKTNLGNKLCYYYAHRDENSIKLSKVQNIGFEVKLNQKPFELLFPELIRCPEIICSFYSPILDTLSKQYSQIPIFIIYRFNLSLLLKSKNIIQMILEAFEKNKRLVICDI